jgi:hypothetical protein
MKEDIVKKRSEQYSNRNGASFCLGKVINGKLIWL